MSDFFKTDLFYYIILGMILLLFVLYIMNQIKLKRIKKQYQTFLKKLGNGTNIEDSLFKIINQLERLESKNQELSMQYQHLEHNVGECIQKVGVVRYSAFHDIGSDLSFAVALLNEDNTGIVFNGIYSPEASNIYAKPIVKGKSTYSISEEEKQAINRAISGS